MSSYDEWMNYWKNSTIRDCIKYPYSMLEEQYNVWNGDYMKSLENGENMNTQENIRRKCLRDIYREQLDILAPDESTSIDILIRKLNNMSQCDILRRLTTDKEYSKIYLSKYVDNNQNNSDIIASVFVWGTFNSKKNKREEYEIKISKDNKMFRCNCMDFKFNSVKKDIMCKHICFLLCKVGKIMKRSVFLNKKLSDEDLTILLNKLKGGSDVWNNLDITKLKIELKSFKQSTKPIDDCCPLCYEDIVEEMRDTLVSCPVCKNYIHTDCIEIWMEQHYTCMICKSDVWKHYKNNMEIIL